MPSQEFLEALEKMKEVHIKKNEDYADENNPFSNFDVSEYCISLFRSNRDKTFVWPIATKLARLATLLNNSKLPNNESIEDSLIDIANYILLWRADIIRSKRLNQSAPTVESLMNVSFHETSLIKSRDSRTNNPESLK